MTYEFWRQNTIQIFHSNQIFDGSRRRIDKKKTCVWAWIRIRLRKNNSLVRHWQLLFVPYARTINQNKIFQKLAHKSGEGTKWHLKTQSNLKMTPINPKSAQKRYTKKWYFPVHQNMKVTHFLPGKTCKSLLLYKFIWFTWGLTAPRLPTRPNLHSALRENVKILIFISWN